MVPPDPGCDDPRPAADVMSARGGPFYFHGRLAPMLPYTKPTLTPIDTPESRAFLAAERARRLAVSFTEIDPRLPHVEYEAGELVAHLAADLVSEARADD